MPNMTLLEFCQEFKISQPKAKRMLARGVLLVSESPDKATAKIVDTLAQRNFLAASDLCALLEAPGIALHLGRYSERALDQLEPVGDAIEGQAPKPVALAVADAARGDPDSVQALVEWIKCALPPAGEVSHSWLACRLLLPLPANIRQFENIKIVRALAYCRKTPEFSGWFRYERKSGRNFSLYSRPKALDL